MLAWNELLTDLAWHEILHRHFRPLQNRKWITAKWLTHGKQLQGVVVWGKLENPSSRPILIYFEFRSKPSLITVICMDPHSPNKLIATKFCFLIVGGDTSFFFVIIKFTKIISLLLFYLINFFHENYFCFFMFRDVPACSGIFRNVPKCMFRVRGFSDALGTKDFSYLTGASFSDPKTGRCS